MVYNQIPGVSSMINLATIQSNSINYMQIELEYGSKTDFSPKDGYRTISTSNGEDNNRSVRVVNQGLQLKVVPFCTTDLIKHLPPKHPAVHNFTTGTDETGLTIDGFLDELFAE